MFEEQETGKSMPYYVYELIDTNSGERFYIGKTGNPAIRLQDHLDRKCISTAGFIASCQAFDVQIDMRIVKECLSEGEAHELERQFIQKALSSGERICNARGVGRPRWLPNHGASWDNQQRRRVLLMHMAGVPRSAIARRMGRSSASIRWALRRVEADFNSLATKKSLRFSI